MENRLQTVELLHAYQERGDSDARERLVELYVPLVESLAHWYADGSDLYGDLDKTGRLALFNAIHDFDADESGDLSAFVVSSIATEMRRHLRDRGSVVQLPRRVHELRAPARRVEEDLAATLGRTPTVAELTAELNAREEDVAIALDAAVASPTHDAATAGAVGGANAESSTSERRLVHIDAARRLTDLERRILQLRYIRDLEPKEVADELGLSARQLSRETRSALEKLRDGVRRPVPGQRLRAGEQGAGKLLVRLPQSLHGELARLADAHGTSLPHFVTGTLERAVGERTPPISTLTWTSTRRHLITRVQIALLVLVVALATMLLLLGLRS